MFRLKIAKWTVRLYAVTVIAVTAAFLFSVLAVAPEIDHRIPSVQTAAELVIHSAVIGDAAEKIVPDVNCHYGPGCVAMILPSGSLVPAYVVGSPERPTHPHIKSSLVKYLLFYPPRLLSQV
ncbi:hypothetical protein [Hoeflea sp. IMCC20628]|uniref:hypothetical protein n=1 Tax=Hoeflea sp. IMCC20628 TaxID=1620421 RepID=UPI00063AA764|nr:hypothetical protein [Hoeflea sp. IMCC20628]